MKFFAATALLLLGMYTYPGLAEASQDCSDPSVQNLCGKTCFQRCSGDPAFQRNNMVFCTSVQSSDALKDDRVCANFSLVPTANDTESSSSGTAPTEGTVNVGGDEDCMRFESRPEQLRCLQNKKGRPSCSSTAVSLENDAQLLVAEVRQELEQYGDLLTRDLTDVASRDLLCRFSLEDLDQNYQRATNDPGALRTIQRRADTIQDCRQQWEDYLRNRATSSSINDDIIQNTAESTRERFKPLTEQLQNLSTSITTLEQAASTIDGLIIIHMDFCPPEGLAAPDKG